MYFVVQCFYFFYALKIWLLLLNFPVIDLITKYSETFQHFAFNH